MILTKEEIENYRKAGDIAKRVKQHCIDTIEPGQKLGEVAEDIEGKIKELGGEIAFPVNLSIDGLAAHNTPLLHDDTPTSGLLKIDIGVHINGYIVDTAISLDLTKDNKHKKIIQATKDALEAAIELVKRKKDQTKVNEIGKIVHKTITEAGFSPIVNLSGHSLDRYQVHSGITIPNYDNKNELMLGEGAFAIEPFATYGIGKVYEGKESHDYIIMKKAQVRDRFARDVLAWIEINKKTLPFSARELEREFGAKARIALKRLEEARIIRGYPQLLEKSHEPVTQVEHTILIVDGKIEVLS